jgi:hypothetical protein
VAKVEWHPCELYPRVGFIVTNMTRPAERVTLFSNQRGTAEQHSKEGKNAITWTRLSCRRFAANAVRLQLHALARNLANLLRTLALPEAVSRCRQGNCVHLSLDPAESPVGQQSLTGGAGRRRPPGTSAVAKAVGRRVGSLSDGRMGRPSGEGRVRLVWKASGFGSKRSGGQPWCSRIREHVLRWLGSVWEAENGTRRLC